MLTRLANYTCISNYKAVVILFVINKKIVLKYYCPYFFLRSKYYCPY